MNQEDSEAINRGIGNATTRAVALHAVASGEFAVAVDTLKGMTLTELTNFERDLETTAALTKIVRRRRAHDEWQTALKQAEPSKEDQP